MRDADPKVSDIGRAIEDDFATIRDCYGISAPLFQRCRW